MRENAYLNNQNFHNFLLTPDTMRFTDSGFPIVKALTELPTKEITGFLPFNFLMSRDCSKKAIHFYIQDYMFDRVWNSPNKYISALQKCPLVTGPDFSLFRDTPYPIQIFSAYKTRWLEAYWQSKDITVVPNVRWSDHKSYEWCFNGLPTNSIISISATGCLKEKEAAKLFFAGYEKAQSKLKPRMVILHCAKGYVDKLKAVTKVPCRFVTYSYLNGE